jgi:transposase-like protein
LAKPSPQELRKRRTHSPVFKAKVAMETISGRKKLQEIAADHAAHPIQESQWNISSWRMPPENVASGPLPVA